MKDSASSSSSNRQILLARGGYCITRNVLSLQKRRIIPALTALN